MVFDVILNAIGSSIFISSFDRKYAPFLINSLFTSAAWHFLTTRACSLAQTVPLSNVFDMNICSTVNGTSALLPIKTGTLPGPTPIAGLPELYAARTSAVDPVASIMAVFL